MSTTYLNNSRVAAALYMRPVMAQSFSVNSSSEISATANKKGIDQNLLKVGFFCFMIPTIFISATLGLDYLSMNDVWDNIVPVSAAFVVARIATAFVMKGLAAEKNNPALAWMSAAMIVPAFSLIMMSLFGNAIGKKNASSKSKNHKSAELKVAAINVSPVVNINRTAGSNIDTAYVGIDHNLLQVGFFCFMIPTMFLTAAFGLEYMELRDVWANILPLSAAFITSRIATAFIIKGMAAQRNRSEAIWMMTAMAAPALSLMLISLFRSLPGQTISTPSNQPSSTTASVKNLYRAREINLNRGNQAA